MPGSRRDIGCSFPLLVPERSIGACVEKRFDDICSAFLGRDHQRAISKVVALVRSRALLQQTADDVIHAGFRSQYQRSISRQGASLEIGLVADKKLRGVAISIFERSEQGGTAAITGSDGLIDRAHGGVFAARCLCE